MKNDSTKKETVKEEKDLTVREDQKPVPKLNEAQMSILTTQTPQEAVKSRTGRGNKSFPYVEVGYVIRQLNEAFNYMWDFEIEQEQIVGDQVWVKGKLRIHVTPEFSIIKSAFGGSDIKKYDRVTKRVDGKEVYEDHPKKGQAIDLGDDLKSAAADALKKAASMVGIAFDVYYPKNKGNNIRWTTPEQEGRVVTPADKNYREKIVCSECHAVIPYHAPSCPRKGEVIH